MGTKRKERDGEEVVKTGEEHHGSTLFVTSLPYTLTSTDLQTLFADHAPVRQAFVVLDRETKVSKGVGYVSFAVREDAERLVEELKGGVDVLGRKVRVQWPGTKAEQEAKAASPNKAKHPRPVASTNSKPKHAHTQTDPDAGRTIVISGLPSTITSKEIWKKARKQAGAEKVVFPLPADDGGDEGTAHVVYDSHTHALAAVEALHAHTFKGSLLSVVLKKRLDSSLKLPAASVTSATATGATDTANGAAAEPKSGKSGKAQPSRAGRLIVRNLPFHITVQDLRSIFLPYGPVHSIEIPTLPSPPVPEGQEAKKARKPRVRGFAFVWMLTKGEAEKALEGVNGMVLGEAEGREGRKVAVDWAVSKERWDKAEEAAAKEGVDAVESENEEEAEDEDMEDAEAEAAEEDDEEEGSEEEEAEEGNGVYAEDDGDGEEDDEDAEDGEAEEDDEDDEEPKSRPLLPQTDVGTTLFVRNIPFEATEDDLRTTFRAFGPLRYARITLEPDSGRSRGTGFVCFWNKPDADRAIADAELLAAETGPSALQNGEKQKRQNPFAVQSLLTPDPSSGLARNLVLMGRTLSVVRAVPRDDATRLKEEGEKRREKEDKRHLYLMREGVIFPNTPASATISPAELDRRVASFNTRRSLLRTNPSLYISKTRLSVRQIPTFATERTLKRLAIHAVRAFEDEVRSGDRTALTRDELDDDTAPSSGSQKKRGERQTAVVQAKIVRQAERVDPLSGKGKSKGYGFLEMRTHAGALRVLRWANNNPDVVLLMTGWWKEELEDSLKKLDEQLKAEKVAEKKEDLNDRIRKMKQRIKGLADDVQKGKAASDGKEGRGLILEFSIENIQVVKRRKETVENSREQARTRKVDGDGPAGEERPRKRPKKSRSSNSTLDNGTLDKIGKQKPVKGMGGAAEVPPGLNGAVSRSLGGLIGKKRKERKAKTARRG